MNTNKLVIVVKDLQNNLASNAQVSLSSGSPPANTDKNGEVVFDLPNTNKITVTVKINGDTREIPYYISAQSSHRLEINFASLKQVLVTPIVPKSNPPKSSLMPTFFLLMIVLFVIFIGFLFSKKSSPKA